jgi:hypothetical protein
VFSDDTNPGRKRPFDVRNVMHAVIDQDHDPLERWSAMQDGEIGVVWDAHLAGRPVCLVGMESRPLTRAGLVPADGPDHWTAGTLFPNAAKKIARAINAASGNRPLVVLANLSGFDGSPESMRRWQLEYGAEIGRAVVNFDGPIVFCVISRYHGGAFVVFSWPSGAPLGDSVGSPRSSFSRESNGAMASTRSKSWLRKTGRRRHSSMDVRSRAPSRSPTAAVSQLVSQRARRRWAAISKQSSRDHSGSSRTFSLAAREKQRNKSRLGYAITSWHSRGARKKALSRSFASAFDATHAA